MHTEFRRQRYPGPRDSNSGWHQRGRAAGFYACRFHCARHTKALGQASTDTRSLKISDAVGNEYGKPKDLAGETRMAFTSHADAAFDVCFENQLVGHRKPHSRRAPTEHNLIASLLYRGRDEPASSY